MSDQILPEELIYEILKHAIQASPDVFLNPSHDRAFFRRPDAPPSPITSSHLLLVSKAWLRIGTPLLYTSLWISNDAHTETLLRLFAETPSFGARVQDLRLDEGFGKELYGLVQYMPNVHNVHLSWTVDHRFSMEGLRMVMPVLKPKRLWLGPHDLVDRGREERQEAIGLIGLLATCIEEKWASLEYVYLDHWYPLLRETAGALESAPALKVLSLYFEDVYDWSWSPDRLRFLDNQSLKMIYSRSADSPERARGQLEKDGVKKRIIDKLTFIREDVPRLVQ